MTTVFHEPCNNFTQWTKVETDGDIISDSGSYLFENKVGTSPTTLGVYLPTPIADYLIGVGCTLYFQIKPIGGTNLTGNLGIVALPGLNQSGMDWNTVGWGSNRDQMVVHYSTSQAGSSTNTSQGNDTIPNGAWSDIKLNYVASTGEVEFYYRPTQAGTEGAFDINAGSWTLAAVGTTPRFSIASNAIGGSPYLFLSMDDPGNGTSLRIDEIYLTDDGIIGEPVSANNMYPVAMMWKGFKNLKIG